MGFNMGFIWIYIMVIQYDSMVLNGISMAKKRWTHYGLKN